MKDILLIEDEVHKREELSSYLIEIVGEKANIHFCDSVRTAVLAVQAADYDLIVLDMALPTFSAEGGAIDGGLDQALGGVEVLRALKSLSKRQSVIIVTQYPDIFLDGRRVKLRAAQFHLEKKYGQVIEGAVLYKYRSAQNLPKIKKIMGSIK